MQEKEIYLRFMSDREPSALKKVICRESSKEIRRNQINSKEGKKS